MNAQQIMERFPREPTESARVRSSLLGIFWSFERVEVDSWLIGSWMGTVFSNGVKDESAVACLAERARDAAADFRKAAADLEGAATDLEIVLLDRHAARFGSRAEALRAPRPDVG